MAKKIKHPEHVNHERWLVSYADFITLLFAFFTVLYATSQTDSKKVKEFVGSVERAFSFTLFEPGTHSVLLDSKNGSIDSGLYDLAMAINELEKNMEETIRENGLSKEMSVQGDSEGLTIRLQTLDLFESGSDVLTVKAREILSKVSVELAKNALLLRIEGHTDNLPIKGARFVGNWELSSARSLSVLRELIRDGIVPERLSTAAYAQYKPLASNDTAAGRSKNRRVELVVLKKSAQPRDTDVHPPALGPLTADLRSTFGAEGAVVGRIISAERPR